MFAQDIRNVILIINMINLEMI